MPLATCTTLSLLLLLLLLQIIECSFDMEHKVWVYMRERTDKDTANHKSVFEKVMTSITDNITVSHITTAVTCTCAVCVCACAQPWIAATANSPQPAHTACVRHQQPRAYAQG
jgi:hypothetical protein